MRAYYPYKLIVLQMSRKKYHHKIIFLEVGKRIRKVRNGLTQKEFAHILGCKQNTVSRWEKWGVAPDEDTLEKIANYGGVSVEWLMRGNTAPAQELQTFKEDYVASLSPLETSLLTAVVKQVREVIKKRRLKMPSDQEARLIVRLYDDCRAQHLQPDPHLVDRALLLVD